MKIAYEVLLCLNWHIYFFSFTKPNKYLSPVFPLHESSSKYALFHFSVFRSVEVIVTVFFFVLVVLLGKLWQSRAFVSSTGLAKRCWCIWKEAFHLWCCSLEQSPFLQHCISVEQLPFLSLRSLSVGGENQGRNHYTLEKQDANIYLRLLGAA